MNHTALFGISAALIVGLFAGLQAIVGARVSLADNAVSSGLAMYVAGGIISISLLALFYPTGQLVFAPLHPLRIIMIFLGGLAGVIIVVGSAYAFAKISPAAAVALIIFGQMSIALIADYLGWTGQAPQPIDLRRIAGLALLAGSIWLLMPRSD